jgi:lipopolysaccharide/colanic/teichoic acid biosynthesis glycosyltransferase
VNHRRTTIWYSSRMAIKRLVDLCLSFLALVILTVPWLILAILIKIDSHGPIFFQQLRIGKDGIPFRIFKLRTMIDNAEQIGAGLKISADDERITRVGRWLRLFGLDELPQLINVLRGEMSLVGPRPTIPSQVEAYTTHQRKRLSMRPGITGMVIIRGRRNLSWPERIEVDIEYIERWSLLLDLAILLKTPWYILVTRQGVYKPHDWDDE